MSMYDKNHYNISLQLIKINEKLMEVLWKTVWRFLEKLKTEPPYDSAIPFLGIYSKKTKH